MCWANPNDERRVGQRAKIHVGPAETVSVRLLSFHLPAAIGKLAQAHQEGRFLVTLRSSSRL